MKKIAILLFCSIFIAASAFAEVAIETSISRSCLSLGDETTLDIIISNADGPISKPKISSIQGFSSYSQGSSQEISFINGRKTSRSIFSYVLIANEVGKQKIGPFEVEIGGKVFKIAPVEVLVNPGGGASGNNVRQPGPVQTPSYQAPGQAPSGNKLNTRDIFVRAVLDKSEVYVNEPATLTYTIYTCVTATYKGFNKEPITTGFWVEDFPPEKVISKREENIGGLRYVVADVRKLALFPTQAGVFTLDPGVLAVAVEVREKDDFSFYSSNNIFGRRTFFPPSSYVSQVFSENIEAPKVTLTVKALPETGRPESFNGAVGQYSMNSSIDKTQVKAGDPITYRVRISGYGNINTLQTPKLEAVEGFKIYDSSSSANVSKERGMVEGDKVTETVLVPKKAGTYVLPVLRFSYFDPKSGQYKEIRTVANKLTVEPGTDTEMEAAPVVQEPSGVSDKPSVAVVGQDIRYIKTNYEGPALPKTPLYKRTLYWLLNGVLIFLGVLFIIFSFYKEDVNKSAKTLRLRRSHGLARSKLKKAAKLLKENKEDEFFTEISRVVYGYFADKLNVQPLVVNLELIEAGIKPSEEASRVVQEIKKLFDTLALGRFGRSVSDPVETKVVYEAADNVITLFEKVKLK